MIPTPTSDITPALFPRYVHTARAVPVADVDTTLLEQGIKDAFARLSKARTIASGVVDELHHPFLGLRGKELDFAIAHWNDLRGVLYGDLHTPDARGTSDILIFNSPFGDNQVVRYDVRGGLALQGYKAMHERNLVEEHPLWTVNAIADGHKVVPRFTVSGRGLTLPDSESIDAFMLYVHP